MQIQIHSPNSTCQGTKVVTGGSLKGTFPVPLVKEDEGTMFCCSYIFKMSYEKVQISPSPLGKVSVIYLLNSYNLRYTVGPSGPCRTFEGTVYLHYLPLFTVPLWLHLHCLYLDEHKCTWTVLHQSLNAW